MRARPKLIRRIRRARIADQFVQVFKPAIDIRYNAHSVQTHDGLSVEAIPVENTSALRALIDWEHVQVVAIDEVQFFDEPVFDLCRELASYGVRVIVAGLNMDFRGEPFGVMPKLMACARTVDILDAICDECKGPATMTQRLIDGQPACYDDPIILVAGSDSYEARCADCHKVRPPVNGTDSREWLFS